MNSYLNGRVNGFDTIPNTFNLEKNNISNTESPQNITSRNLNCTAVSDMFFSIENINLLQLGIRNTILNQSNV